MILSLFFLFTVVLLLPLDCLSELQTVTKSVPISSSRIGNNVAKGLSTWWDTSDYPHSVTYVSFCWDQIEQVEGVYDWSVYESALSQAKSMNHLFAFRIQGQGGPGEGHEVPGWLRARMGDVNGYTQGGTWYPDHNHPDFLTGVENLIDAARIRFADDPWVLYVDGYWGEWHMYSIPDPPRDDLFPTPSNAQQIIDWVLDAFPNKAVVMLVDNDAALSYAVSERAGIRADCFGDWNQGGWNHMTDAYPDSFAIFGEAWKTPRAAVVFEPCYTFRYQEENGYPMSQTYQKGLEWHVTTINAKDEPIGVSQATDPEWLDFVDRMGYKLQVSEASLSVDVDQGQISASTVWENLGVAPPIVSFVLEYRVQLGNSSSLSFQSSSISLSWLPGAPFRVSDTLEDVDFQNSFPTSLKLCLFYEVDSDPFRLFVKLAQESEMDASGCYEMLTINRCNGVSEFDPGACPGGKECQSDGVCRTSQSTTEIIAIVAGSVAGTLLLVAILIAVVIVVICVCRNRKSKAGSPTTPREMY